MDRLNDKVALVTGAARGIGEAIARAYAREGALVWLTDIEEGAGQARALEIGERATFSRLDMREEEDWSRVTSKMLAAFGKLDVVVNRYIVLERPKRLQRWRRSWPPMKRPTLPALR